MIIRQLHDSSEIYVGTLGLSYQYKFIINVGNRHHLHDWGLMNPTNRDGRIVYAESTR